MKKMTRVLACILALCVAVSSLSVTVFAKESSIGKTLEDATAKGIEAVLDGALGLVDFFLPDGKNFYDKDTFQSANFIKGHSSFRQVASKSAKWHLGTAEVSLVPEDYQEHDYYLGGYIMLENGMNNHVEELLDDMKARVIAIDDNSGRGTAVFATIDCIGMTNKDIQEIRSRLIKKADNIQFSGVTVSATHCHSGIDTEGLWTNIVGKAVKNLFKSLLHIGDLETGTDPKYMEFVYETVSDAMLQACKSMEFGTMTYASKDIGSDYFVNKNRSSASALMTNMNRFVFTPFNESAKSTMIVNVAAHPDVAGLPTSDGQGNGRGVSGDYIYYMGKTINDAGYNFMFFNGAIAGIYMSRGVTNNGQQFTRRVQQSERYGNELGKMALAMTLTEDEILSYETASGFKLVDKDVEAKEIAVCGADKYHYWYKDWTPVKEIRLNPLFNIRFRQVDIPVENPFIRIAGKLNLAAYDVLKKGKDYYIRTEIGYMEFGTKQVCVALMPGEVCQDLVVGGTSLTADGSFSGKDFGYKTITELFGENTIVFGLANDAIGYVIPDNDFCMCIAFDHYHELICLGEYTASTIMQAFGDLAEICVG